MLVQSFRFIPVKFDHISRRSAVSLAFNCFGEKENRSLNPLVIGHGLFGQKSNWNSVGKQLQKKLDNQVYVLDFRNHGDSPHISSMTYPEMTEDVVKFVKEVVIPETGFETIHFLGHSMGGKVASLFALDPSSQGLLKSVIVEDVTPISQSRNIHFKRYVQHMKGIDLTKSRKDISDDLAHVITDLPTRQFLLTNLASDNGTDRLRWKPNLDSIGDHIEHILRFTINSGKFDKPTLFIYGENSGYVKEDDFGRIRQLFPKVQFQSIPKSGHWVHADNPSDFVDSIVKFIRSC